MKVKNLKPLAQEALFDRIVTELCGLDNERFEVVLQKIVDVLDELDQEDFFGTEGWKHLTGDDE